MLANACAVLCHERLFSCVGLSLLWRSEDRAATSRRNRIQLQNWLRLRLCRGARPVARPRGARGDSVPRRGCEFAFSHPRRFAKNAPTQNGIKWYEMVYFLGYSGIPFMSQKKIQFYTILYHFVLARFLQIEGGAKKQIRTPCGGPNPRARRAGERPAEPRDKAAGEANFVIRCGCVLRLSVGRDAEELVSKIIFVIFFYEKKNLQPAFSYSPHTLRASTNSWKLKSWGRASPPKLTKLGGAL